MSSLAAHSAKESLENLAQATESGHILEATGASGERSAGCPGMAEAVIRGALVGVGQDGISFVDLFEFRLGIGFLVAVRVVLESQLTEGLF